MAFTLQANKKTTISGDFAAGATSLTLATAAFTNFTDGYLVIDYDNNSKFEIIKCTVTGTAVTSITRAQSGTSDVDHSSGAKIGFMFVPTHYSAITDGTGIDDGAITASKIDLGASAHEVATSQGTTSASYTDLATSGPAVTVTVGANGLLMVGLYSWASNSTTQEEYMGFALSSGNTLAADDARALYFAGTARISSGATFLLTGLTPGSTVVTAKYRATGGSTGTFVNRRIFAIPL